MRSMAKTQKVSMLEAIEEEANYTLTENYAKTLQTSGSDCLDLFSTIGAMRNLPDDEVLLRFTRAYAEEADIAMRILFYARDIRGGLGERKVFRTILKYLAVRQSESVLKNLERIPEYGRYDDLLELLDTPCEERMLTLVKDTLDDDLKKLALDEPVSLLGKWLPSINTSSKESVAKAVKIANGLGLSPARYRKSLSALRRGIKIIENDLRERDYTFEYEKQPSKALYKYKKAFIRNDLERYNRFLEQVAAGAVAMHTGTLMPYDVIASAIFRSRNAILSEEERLAMDTTWNALEDFTGGENALAVVDGSASMYDIGRPAPIAVALSLGIYFAERNKGAFHNHFITFSTNPQLVEIKGKDIADKVEYCESFNEVADTNIQKVFELVLSSAVKNGVPQEELPSALYFITDMEWNICTEDAGLTNFQYAKRLYEEHGYKLPQVVFWNVNSRNRQQPVRMNEEGVILVSGASARIFSMIAGRKLSPYEYMLATVNSERYIDIVA